MSTSPDSRWAPADASGAGLVFTGVNCAYAMTDNMVHVFGRFTFPITADASPVSIGGLPVRVMNQLFAQNTQAIYASGSYNKVALAVPIAGTSTFAIDDGSATQLTNSQLSGALIVFMIIYPGVLS